MTGSTVPLQPPNIETVMRLDNATVTRAVTRSKEQAHSGTVYDSKGARVHQAQRFPQIAHKWCDPPSLAEALADGRQVERRLKRAIYLGHAYTHFGRLLVETVPNLCWVPEVDADTLLLFHPFSRRCLNVFTDVPHGIACRQLLGIAPERIVMADIDLAVDELLLPPRAYNAVDGPLYDYRAVYRAMREAALKEAPVATGPPAGRVYLSRRLVKDDARIANEVAVERHLLELGFAILYPERMRLVEQIRAVAEADLVVGVDGSALHLSAFMRAGTHILVLRTKRRRNIGHVNDLMGVSTAFLDATPPSEDSSSKTPTIDLDKLAAALTASSSGVDALQSSSALTDESARLARRAHPWEGRLRNGRTLVTAYDEYMKLRHEPVPFTLESVVTWMIMATFAEALSTGPGDHLELGVMNGGSAFLHMLLMRPEEEICLVDRQRTMIFDQSFRMLEENVQRRVHYVRALTTAPETDPLCERSFRWIHIDAGHAREVVLADLERYEPTLRGDGLLVMDDFFQGRVPGVTEAIYQFLHQREPNLRPILVAFNKVYFCRSELYDSYLTRISEGLETLLRSWGRFNVDDIRMNDCFCYHARGAMDATRRGSRR